MTHTTETRDGMEVLVVSDMGRRFDPETGKELKVRQVNNLPIVHASEIARYNRMRSVTGETFTELTHAWPSGFGSIEETAEAAMAAFQKYAEGKSGTLYWRIPPEIAYGAKQKKFAYYMRLLISDKPKVST